jgi:O-antigen/teichoic acid export membrane protein
MSTKKLIIKNIFSLSIANVFTRILSALAGIVIARYFALDVYGSYQTSFAYVAMFGVISDLGISQFLVRDGARNIDNFEELSNNALMLEIILTSITFIVMIIFLFFTNYEKLTILFIIIISVGQLIIDSTFTPVVNSVLQVYNKLHISAYITIASSVFNALLIFCFAYFRLSSIAFALIYPISSVIFLIIKIWIIKDSYKLKFVLNFQKIKYVIKESIPFGASSIASYIYLQAGVFILSLMLGEQSTGLFSASFKLILITYTIPGVIYLSFMNKMFSYSSKNHEVFIKYFNTLFRVLLPIGIFISFNFFYFGKDIILFLYKAKFSDTIIIFKYLSILIILEFINYPPASLFTFIDRQKTKSIIQCIIAVLNVFFSILFIKYYGMIGVAYAIILTDTIKNIIWYIVAYKSGYKIYWNKRYIIIPAAFIIIFLIYQMLHGIINFILLGILGTLIFSFILFICGYLNSGFLRDSVK